MDWAASYFEILFLILALALVPATNHLAPLPTYKPASQPPTPAPALLSPFSPHSPLSPLSRSAHAGPMVSPAPSPNALAVPMITVTPEHARRRGSHKRKSVSFSLSSMDEIRSSTPINKRPPTPFVSGPASPNAGKIEESAEEGISVPGTPRTPMSNQLAVDSMGVQKSWLRV